MKDEREIEAVVAALWGGPTAPRIGKNVRAMEQRVADGLTRAHFAGYRELFVLPRLTEGIETGWQGLAEAGLGEVGLAR